MKRTKMVLWVVCISILVAALLAYWSFREGARVDACLDQGGRYDYESKSCVDSRYKE